MVRNILAVVGGWLAAIVLWWLTLTAWYLLASVIAPDRFPFPPPAEGNIPTDTWFLAGSLVCDALAGLAAGYLIVRLAHKPAHQLMWVVTVLLALLLVLQVAVDHGRLPMWLGLVRFVLMPLALWIGARLAGLDPPAAAAHGQDAAEQRSDSAGSHPPPAS
jgi:hypothetical protein